MNDYERRVTQHIQALERLLKQSLDWEVELAARPADARARHNEWADARQPLFVQHLQEARGGLITTSTAKRKKAPKPAQVEAWTPQAVASHHQYVLEFDHSLSLVGAVFAEQASRRLSELEREWDAQLGHLYELSRR